MTKMMARKGMILFAILLGFLPVSYSNHECSNLTKRQKYIRFDISHPSLWRTSYNYRMGGTFESMEGQVSSICVIDDNPTVYPWQYIPIKTLKIKIQCLNGAFSKSFGHDINNNALANFTDLLLFQAINCYIPRIAGDAFIGLKKLSMLEIGNAGLRTIESDFLKNLPQLVWLRVLTSDIRTIDPDIFLGNTRLMFLQLINCNITSLRQISDGRTTNQTITLNSFILQGNVFRKLGENFFEGYDVGGILNVEQCKIHVLHSGALNGLNRVVGIDLSNNEITIVPHYFFMPANMAIQLINLTNNNISFFDLRDLGPLKSLTHLKLGSNNMSSIAGNVKNLPSIEVLDLTFNALESVPDDLLRDSQTLSLVYLNNNCLKSINETFQRLTNLQYLNLSNNQINFISRQTFTGSKNMLHLNLSKNGIRHIEGETFLMLTKLFTLDLSYNDLISLDKYTFSGLESLRFLNISFNKIKTVSSEIFSQTFTSAVPISFQVPDEKSHMFLEEIDFSHNDISLIKLNIIMNSLKIVKLDNNRIENLNGDFITAAGNLTYLNLRDNRLIIPPLSEENTVNLQVLDLGNNNIQSLPTLPANLFEKLQSLKLDNNEFQSINVEFLRNLRVKVFFFSDNPIPCDCSIESFVQWLKVRKFDQTDKVTCINSQNSVEIVQLVDFSQCNIPFNAKTVIIPISVTSLTLLIVLTLTFWFRYEIQVLIYHRWRFRFTNLCNKTKIERFEHDAFICFVDKDIDFVLHDLVPFLQEQHGHRLIIHYRDFNVGDNITDNIISSIERSARVVVVLSGAFLLSEWGTFEFRQAFYSEMKRKEQKLIVILMEDSVLGAKMDKLIKLVLKTKTYLKRDDHLFWKKLLFAMPEATIPRSNSEEELLNTNEID